MVPLEALLVVWPPQTEYRLASSILAIGSAIAAAAAKSKECAQFDGLGFLDRWPEDTAAAVIWATG